MMTETEFINSEMVVWGDEYIENLIDQGYTPILTTAGWKWIWRSAIPADVAERIAAR